MRRVPLGPVLITSLLVLAGGDPSRSAESLRFLESHFIGFTILEPGLAVSPDGAHVYVFGDHTLVSFARDVSSGKLTQVQSQFFPQENPAFIVLSPDGKHAYITVRVSPFSGAPDRVEVYARNATTGILSFVEAHLDDVDGVDGIDFAQAITLSPDGSHVYVAGLGDNAIAVFSRDAVSGALTFVEVQRDGIGGVDGLDGIWCVVVSPDGAHVYSAAVDDDAPRPLWEERGPRRHAQGLVRGSMPCGSFPENHNLKSYNPTRYTPEI